jgi:hypothetical protein
MVGAMCSAVRHCMESHRNLQIKLLKPIKVERRIKYQKYNFDVSEKRRISKQI